jgi:hypothetical protein
VAVAVGSGAEVSVGRGGGVTVNAAAVSVNCDTTVLAAEVLTAAISGVASGVVEGPHAAVSMMTRDATMISFDFIEPPSCAKFIS